MELGCHPRARPRRSLLVGVSLLCLFACSPRSAPPDAEENATPTPSLTPPPQPLFVDRAAETGLDFVYSNGMSGEFFFPEMTGGGAALFDYDNDGDLDAYLVQGGMLGPGKTQQDALFPELVARPANDRLYRNELAPAADGTPRPRFTDVTGDSGIDSRGYGMGVAAGDFNHDGWVDLYITNLGPNVLWQNQGDGTFRDVTERSGTGDGRWSVAATFFDYDGDGWLDLYVGNYVDFNFSRHKVCPNESGAPDYCGPLAYEGERDRLWRNRRDGTFEEVSLRAGPGSTEGSTLGAAAGDFNGDGRLDLYVARDQMANELWLNQGDGTFRDEALLGGCAVNLEGQPEASMGVAAADFDNDGDEDLFLTHLTRETNTLYRNQGKGLFDDRSRESGVGAPSWDFTGFGVAWLDYDNDGWLDLLVANGAVKTLEPQVRARDPYPLRQTNQLFRNRGDGGFEEVTALAGEALAASEVSRGVAFGDVDNDGDSDALLVNSNAPARLLINQTGQDNPWLGLRLVDPSGKTDRLGAWVGLTRGGKTLWRRTGTDGSYASARDPRVLFGLGGGDGAVERIEVRWPGGGVEEWDPPPLGVYTTVRQGSGREVR